MSSEFISDSLVGLYHRSSTRPFVETTFFYIMKQLGYALEDRIELPGGVWVAGGAIRRTLINAYLDSDVDFFFRDSHTFEEFVRKLESNPKISLLIKNEKNSTYLFKYADKAGLEKEIKIQLIFIQYYPTPEELLDSFDFTICQFATDGKTVWMGKYSLWDLGRRRLAVHKITYPVASVRRMMKYGGQGFTICSGCIKELLLQSADVNIEGGESVYID